MIKKLLSFVVLFGAGIGVLLWFDSGRQSKTQATAERAHQKDPPSVRPASPSTPAGGLQLIPSGPLEITHFKSDVKGEAVRRMVLEAQNSGPGEASKTLLEDVTITLLDPKDQEPVAIVRAEHATCEVVLEGDRLGEASISPDILLEQVVVSLLRGSRLVPVELRSDELLCNMERALFTTDGRAVIEGSGLRAEGTGFRLEEPMGLLSFDENANCTITAEGGQPGRLACTGRLEIRQPPDDERRPLFIDAQRNALLAVEGSEGLSLSAHSISVRGRVDEAQGERFMFERLEAEKEVNLRARGHEFSAQKSSFELDPLGNLKDAVLSGGPRAWLKINPEYALAGEADDRLAFSANGDLVEVTGEGEMRIEWQPEPVFQVGGPARLEWRDAKLWAAGGLAGGPTEDKQSTRFHAWTGVEVSVSGWKVTTDDLRGNLLEQGLSLRSEGFSRIGGNSDDGRAVELLARQGFRCDFDGTQWKVPEAHAVDLSVGGPSAFGASALELRDFDPLAPAFLAIGDVQMQSGLDDLRGDRLVVKGPESLALYGLPEEPVSFGSMEGQILADEIHRSGDSLDARGHVTADVKRDLLSLKLRSSSLSLSGFVDRQLLSQENPLIDRPVLVVARGDVVAEFKADGRSYDVTSDNLRLWRSPVEASQEYRTELAGRGQVHATIQDPAGHYRVESGELDGLFFDPFERPAEVSQEEWRTQTRGTLDARGTVFVERLDEPRLSGRGDTFRLDEDRTAHLIANDGRRVRAEGFLPGTGEPFQLTALRADFAAEHLRAEAPEILIVGREGRSDIQRGQIALKELLANSKLLEATRTNVLFTGEVSFVAHGPEQDVWTLRSELARFDHSGNRLSQAGAFDQLVAEKNVRLSFSDGPEVTGDYLTADALTGRVKVTGTPARFYGRDMLASSWFHFDTKNFLPSSGPGWIGPLDSENDRSLSKQR